MEKTYDIGVVGCWYWGNYGSLLNGYATNYLLKSFGLRPLNIITPNNGFEPHAKKFFEVAYQKEDISELLPFERVHEFNDICGMFLTGSDQIWNFKSKGNRQYDAFFRLDFADDSKRKISFATSMGKYNKEPEELYVLFQKLYNRYNAISVRETETVEIMKNRYSIKAECLIEPVLDLPKDCWLKLAEYSQYNEKSGYLLTYILDPTPEKRNAIEFYSNKLGIKTINILDGFSGLYEKNKQKLNLPGTLPNIWCADFLKYFSNASYVITDSFHGVCFSLIFNRPFLAIANYSRGISRFKTLLNEIGMENRLVSDKDIPMDEKYLYHLNFDTANDVIRKKRQDAISWLENAINNKNKPQEIQLKKHVNTFLLEEDCTGCGACVSICPVNVINFSQDQYGAYKAKVDERKCISCGKCKEICPAIELPYNLNSSNPLSYAFIASDKSLVMESSSGGVFSVLAKIILNKGGLVAGAAWNDDFTIKHLLIEKIEDLPKLQKSKYFQSYMGTLMRNIKQALDSGKEVLFSGTPCQVTGLKKFLGINYSNLILIDLFCAHCPGSGFFLRYLQENFPVDEITRYDFRYKDLYDKKWDCNKIKITNINNIQSVRTIKDDDYLQAFHTCSWIVSSHCLKCKYQGGTRIGDLTIGDCWGIENFDASVDASKGVSTILVNNEKGRDFLKSIPSEEIALLKREPLEEIKKYNRITFIENRNWQSSNERNIFLSEFLKNGFLSAKKKVENYVAEKR